MEHLAGESLAERLKRGPVPLAQALDVAAQIAEALDAAHKHGIVHRDLKPGNVMLTTGGAGRSGVMSAKLLDFGLAKLTGHGERPALVCGATAPTMTAPVTARGTILGTLPYMAPEQLEGKEADARTDLWALGAILYEMVTGRRAFEGDSQVSLIGNIMNAEPAGLATLQPLTPPALERVVKKCLAKRPDDRWDTAHDVADDLRWIAQTSGMGALNPVQPRRRIRLAWGVALAAFLLAVVATTMATLVWTRSSSPSDGRAPVRLLLSDQLPAQTGLDPQRSFAVSGDGHRVAFVAERDGVRRGYVRELNTVLPTEISGTENATAPFFSPDGQRIGFFADNRLKAVSLAGGTPVVLADVTGAAPRGATWMPDDTIIFSPGPESGLHQVPATGGPVRVVAQPDRAKGERGYRWPEVLPGGDAVVFTLATSDLQSFDEARLVVRSLRTGEQRELIRGGSFATYTASGHLLFARAGALMAVPFDVARRAVTGAAKPVLDGLVTYPINGAAQYAVGGDGTLVYIAGRAVSRQATLTWVDTAGKTTMLAAEPAAYQNVSIAPDGREVALDIDGANANIWLLDLARTSKTRMTVAWSNNNPFWTPDGTRVVFTSAGAGALRLFWQAADGRRPPEPVTQAHGSQEEVAQDFGSWTPEGQILVFGERAPRTGWDLWTATMGGERNLKAFVQTPFNERNPRFSPDGRWVAYESDETGLTEVYLVPYPGPGRKVKISTDGGTSPVWARDGRALFYRNGDAMMGVPIQTLPSFSPGRARLLFRKVSPHPFDVAPDGRFLMIEDLPAPALGPLTVALNWHAELKRRLSAAQ
jgi:serine/threonine-protein kinase